jgi:2-polyprenyl-3-methyl-5-hydroxy-6-metoxy-1,4-benzoquinol methylase
MNEHQIDVEGKEILEAICTAEKFNAWMYKTIKPHCKGKILEIGSGIGNISALFLKDNADITLSDLRKNYRVILEDRFNVSTVALDLVHPDFDICYRHLFNSFDTVFALNVIEHIQDDQLAIANCNKLLKENGNLIILVPAFNFLYNDIDKTLEHFRRYKKSSLENIMKKHFTVNLRQYFNVLGTMGWIFYGTILRKNTIREEDIKLYESLFPIAKVLDFFFKKWVGLSVIVVGTKSKE